MTDIHQNEIEFDKKHLHKQVAQSLQVLKNVYILNITCHHMPKYYQVSNEKHTNKHVLVLRHARHHTSANWVLQILKNERKSFSVLQNIFSLLQMKISTAE